jgi:uroporphyrinogen-III synthase
VNAPLTVAVTADRRRDEQALLLERHGLQVAMYPLLQTVPIEGTKIGPRDAQAELVELTRRLCARPPEYLVANTGYGMRTWLSSAREHDLLDGLVAALSGHTKIVARGAKALGELRKVGLEAHYKAPEETIAEVATYLSHHNVAGSTVAVQLHGDPASALEELSKTGAELVALPVYSMSATGEEIPRHLAAEIIGGGLAAVTFTAAPQVQVLASRCRQGGTWGDVLATFNSGGAVAACIGDVCAAGARAEGITELLVPPHPRLASLAGALASRLLDRSAVEGLG